MNIRIPLRFAASALWLAGCASVPRQTGADPYVKPNLVLLTPDQAAQHGLESTSAPPRPASTREAPSPSLDASAVVAPAEIKAYTLNRAVDSADPDLLHEAHVVYRRETAPRWRLDAPTDQKVLIGPRVTEGRQDLQPLLDKELASYLADQRRATEENQKAIGALFQALDAISRQQQALLQRELRAQEQPASPPTASPAAAPASPPSVSDERPAH
jgi:hypothetical protein